MVSIVIDGNGLIAGRLAAFIAKEALRGKTIDIVNAEGVVLSGNTRKLVSIYRKRRGLANYANPEQAAKWPRRPDLLFKRIVEGMLPATSRGKQAASHIKAHLGTPSGLGNPTKLKLKTVNELNNSSVSLGEICKALGWTKRV